MPPSADHLIPDRAISETRLLIALQWVLTIFGLFCLVGAAVLIAITPDAWPM